MDRSSSITKKTDGDENERNIIITSEEKEAEEDQVNNNDGGSIEKIFEETEVPPWQKQLTVRAFVVSFVLGILFIFIFTTGTIPSFNISAGLLGLFFVKTWTKFLEKSGLSKQPFARQENTVIETCVVATSGIAFGGGFGRYLFGTSEVIAKQCSEANNSQNVKNPTTLPWKIGFLFVVSFLGHFSVVSLRKLNSALSSFRKNGLRDYEMLQA